MADEPTIDEAIKQATFVAEYYDGWVPETTAAIRTLLASHASLTADLEEAKRLMKPFADAVATGEQGDLVLCRPINPEDCFRAFQFVGDE